jgi:recombinational DNA repair ATPase RecF
VLQTIGEHEQTLLTTTDLAGFEPGFLARARVFRVEEGTVQPVGS